MPVRESPQAPLVVYTVLMSVITLGFLAWWFLSHERQRGPALPVLLLGGAISGFMEPWLDNVVLVGWPTGQITPTFEAYGRSVPIFVIIGYAWFCGGLLYLVARCFQRNISPRKVWTLYGLVAFIDFVAIGLSSWLGILDFFGDPPMEIAGFPIWWAAIDGLNVLLGGTVVVLLIDHLPGLRQLWLVLVPSAALGASAGIVGWPISIALNSSWPMAAKYGCAVASIGLSLAGIHLIARSLPALRNQTSQPQRSTKATRTATEHPGNPINS